MKLNLTELEIDRLNQLGFFDFVASNPEIMEILGIERTE